MTTPATPLLDVLTLLQAYEDEHVQADETMRKTWLSLARARNRHAGLSTLEVQVREEWVARAVLVNSRTVVPTLQYEDNDESSPNNDNNSPNNEDNGSWKIVDPVEWRQQQRQRTMKDKENDPIFTAVTASETGLRQRRGHHKDSTIEKTSTMTQEDITTYNSDDDHDVLATADPVELLFGALPPREIKQAQQHATLALQHYVRAAQQQRNLLRIILHQEHGNA